MLHHVVLFSTAPGADPDAVFRGLKLLEGIPLTRPVRICRNLNLDQISESVEFVVYGEFRDAAELAYYKSHPLYAESISRVRPLRRMRVAANFYLEEQSTGEP